MKIGTLKRELARKVLPQITDEELEERNQAFVDIAEGRRKNVIEKLTAPPETLEEHAVRLGYTVEKKLVRHAGGLKVWWEEVLEVTKRIETPDKEVVVPDGWTFEPDPNYDRGV